MGPNLNVIFGNEEEEDQDKDKIAGNQINSKQIFVLSPKP